MREGSRLEEEREGVCVSVCVVPTRFESRSATFLFFSFLFFSFLFFSFLLFMYLYVSVYVPPFLINRETNGILRCRLNPWSGWQRGEKENPTLNEEQKKKKDCCLHARYLSCLFSSCKPADERKSG